MEKQTSAKFFRKPTHVLGLMDILSDPGLGDHGDRIPLRPVCPIRDFLFFKTSIKRSFGR